MICDCKYDFSKKDASRVLGLDTYLKILCLIYPGAGALLYAHFKNDRRNQANECVKWLIYSFILYTVVWVIKRALTA